MVARGNTISWKDWCLGDEKNIMWNAVFNDDLIKSLNNTFGEMGRYVLFGKKKLIDEIAENTTPHDEEEDDDDKK